MPTRAYELMIIVDADADDAANKAVVERVKELVADGGGDTPTCPYRLKIRSPSLHALSAIPYILPGQAVSDAVAILGSLDPIMGEVDR